MDVSWGDLVIIAFLLYPVLVFIVRAITMRFMNPVDVQILFWIYAAPLIALNNMRRDLASPIKHWKEKRNRQEFRKLFGFPPIWTPETQEFVDKRLRHLACQLSLTRDGEYFTPVQKGMERYFRRSREIAERCGYIVNFLEKQPERAARKRRRQKKE